MLTKKIIKPIKNNTRKEEKKFKYLDIITTLFVTILLVSNIVAVKIVKIGIFLVPGATLLFPISYIFGDNELPRSKLTRYLFLLRYTASREEKP